MEGDFDLKRFFMKFSIRYPENQLLQFSDLVGKMLEINPKLRITPVQALEHPFISSGNDFRNVSSPSVSVPEIVQWWLRCILDDE